MMEFTPITKEEFPGTYTRGKRRSKFALAVATLEVETGFSTPCVWRHASKTGLCGGISTAHTAAKREGIRVRVCCRDGVFYVIRIEDKEERHDN